MTIASRPQSQIQRVCPTRRREHGFSIVTAIFLIVVLAALGAFMVVFTGFQQSTIQADVLGVRAFYAARAGINWGVYRALDPDNTIASPGPANFAPCPTGTINTAAMGGSLSSFSVAVTCDLWSATEANREIRVYEIIATACNQAACVATAAVPPPGYVERRVRITVAKCKDPTAPPPRYECGQ